MLPCMPAFSSAGDVDVGNFNTRARGILGRAIFSDGDGVARSHAAAHDAGCETILKIDDSGALDL